MLGTDQGLLKEFTQENGTQLLRRLDRLRQFSLAVAVKEKPQTPQATKETTDVAKPKRNNTRLIGMVIVFVVLFAILGYMLMNMPKN